MRRKKKQPTSPNQNTVQGKSGAFTPPPVLSCLGAVVFSSASLMAVSTKWGTTLPPVLLNALYGLAAFFLFLAVWALIPFSRKVSPLRTVSDLAHQNKLLSRLWDDSVFRIVSFGYGSLVANSLLALSKMIAGWWFSSKWFMVLAGYYLVLCVAKALILRNSRTAAVQPDQHVKIQREWRAYRLCGTLLIVLSLALQGVAILIVREGNGFRYHGHLIFAVALYDFYCLTTSIVYLIKNRRKHSPAIMSIKYISFAASLVSMLSLQTAMFASFGSKMELEMQHLMNALTGSIVCAILAALGIGMVMKAAKHRKKARNPLF